MLWLPLLFIVCVGIGPKVSVSMSVEGPSGGVSAGKSVIAQVTGEGVMNNPTGCGLTPDGELLSAANAQPLHAHEAVIPHDEAPVAVAPPGQSPDQLAQLVQQPGSTCHGEVAMNRVNGLSMMAGDYLREVILCVGLFGIAHYVLWHTVPDSREYLMRTLLRRYS
ncbi:hypothetical protein PtA15_2A828 [Puccinia triticina]|uniref:Copper transporter n=1 Tax=Puccinia triticina TaxID=208348 RepID=A0ABY7CED4_9BASI|nr:uncharacterized protein PtA15_2A828 [Puccinia triticina]WAQ82511.1 hypothetical protein PtA15_2A828 [Puccinia triticina]